MKSFIGKRTFLDLTSSVLLVAVLLLGAGLVQAVHFDIDVLNLEESVSGLAAAYLKISFKEAWDKINGSLVNLTPVTIAIPIPKIVKIEVQTLTPQELNSRIQTIKNSNNPFIIEVVENLVK